MNQRLVRATAALTALPLGLLAACSGSTKKSAPTTSVKRAPTTTAAPATTTTTVGPYQKVTSTNVPLMLDAVVPDPNWPGGFAYSDGETSANCHTTSAIVHGDHGTMFSFSAFAVNDPGDGRYHGSSEKLTVQVDSNEIPLAYAQDASLTLFAHGPLANAPYEEYSDDRGYISLGKVRYQEVSREIDPSKALNSISIDVDLSKVPNGFSKFVADFETNINGNYVFSTGVVNFGLFRSTDHTVLAMEAANQQGELQAPANARFAIGGHSACD